jgi:hypothetical protein
MLAYPIAFATALGSPDHSRPNGGVSEIRSTPRLSIEIQDVIFQRMLPAKFVGREISVP